MIGAGSWGISLATLLADNGYSVHLWGRNAKYVEQLNKTRQSHYLPELTLHPNITAFYNFTLALEAVNNIIIATPSKAFRTICNNIVSQNKSYRIAWGTKGIDSESGQLLHTVATGIFPKNTPLAVLSGPSFAKEIIQHTPTAVSLAGNDPNFIQDLIGYFHSDKFRVYANADITGVELCGVFKNVLAIGIGIADGLGLGYNAQAALITRGFAEMRKLCLALNANPETLLSLAGLGDIVLTCTSNLSRNRRFGLYLGEGKSKQAAFNLVEQEVEGAHNAALLLNIAKQQQLDMPIIQAVNAVIDGTTTAKDAVQKLMQRLPNTE